MNSLNSQSASGVFFQSTLMLMIIYFSMGRLLIQALYLGYDLYSRWTGEINPCGFSKKKIYIFLWLISTWMKTAAFRSPLNLLHISKTLQRLWTYGCGAVSSGSGRVSRQTVQSCWGSQWRSLISSVQRPNGSLKAAALSQVAAAAAAEQQPLDPVL